MAASTLITVDEYLATSYRPDCEYLEGIILERNLGEFDHSRMHALLTQFLMNHEKEWGILVVVEPRVQVKSRRFRVPDITVLLAPPADGRIIREPPFLCIELLSPEDSVRQMQERIDDHLNLGVKYVWLIDPTTRRAFTYTSEGMKEAKDGVLIAENPSIRIPLFEL